MSGREDPPDVPATALGRRGFLRLAGAAAAAGGLPGCNDAPPEQIVPYVRRPPEQVPGRSTYYATTLTRGGYGIGVLAESRDGRPIKIEGHPEHPASLGGSGVVEQAALRELYDPSRARTVRHDGQPASGRKLRAMLDADRTDRGRGLALWMPPTSSPLVEALLGRVRERHPEARIGFDPTGAPVERWEGSRRAFGQALEPQLDLERADLVVALDADLLGALPSSLRWARQLGRRRALDRPSQDMPRLYALEPSPTVTGVAADHRWKVAASDVGRVAAALLARVDERFAFMQGAQQALDEPLRGRLEWLAGDLAEHRGRGVVVVGDDQPAEVHVLGHALNAALANLGATVRMRPSPLVEASEGYDPERVLAPLGAGKVELLVTLGGDPARTCPPAWRWAERASRASEHVHLAHHEDEPTARDASWVVPARHALESWGDARAWDGTPSPVQPLVRPLFGGSQPEQLLAALAGQPGAEPRELLRDAWERREGGGTLADGLRRGLLSEGANADQPVELDAGEVRKAYDHLPERSRPELLLRADPRTSDPRGTRNPWIHELPEPMTKLVWGNAALLSPATAAEHGVSNGDVLELEVERARIRVPAFVHPGQHDHTVVCWRGFGVPVPEHDGKPVGVDVTELLAGDGAGTRTVQIRPREERRELVATQTHGEMEDRPLVLDETLRGWRENPKFVAPHDETPVSILPPRSGSEGPQWGMAIDLAACTGCSACVVACQAENNTPVVGKQQVALGREMHWMRIDRYHTGDSVDPEIRVQPMLCQHCEQAPCEYVCPVNATTHSPDGLNEMVYNRCVGTRFCSNNCPYKVRRFNFLEHNDDLEETEKMAHNPDVTVRARGVMEKCTYCVQRIRRAEIDAKVENRRLRDGEIQTACQQACPSEAISFGDISDPETDVSRRMRNTRAYAVLHELGTRPRTRYLAHIRNPREDAV